MIPTRRHRPCRCRDLHPRLSRMERRHAARASEAWFSRHAARASEAWFSRKALRKARP
jgi:hypothetical protein